MLLSFSIAVFITLQLANGVPLQEEKIKPVSLMYGCSRYVLKPGEDPLRSAVILIHGIGGSSNSWVTSALTLAYETKRPVCEIDLRNHARSPWDSKEYDVKAMVADLEHFVDSQRSGDPENFEKVNLIGHSLGGKIAMNFALKNPDMVNSLVVEDMKPTNPTPEEVADLLETLKILREALKLLKNDSYEDTGRDVVADYMKEKLKEKNITDIVSLDENSKKHRTYYCFPIRQCEYLLNIDTLIEGVENIDAFFGESKGLYKGPTMFMYGEESPFHVDKDINHIQKLFPNAKLVGVKGAGHQIHGIHESEFNDLVIRFLNELDN